ncbi:phosphocholine-specific phospholipase C [Collimonas sp.]|jgi:phospholipase C|uniref:phosphocholine-specific phospholipase C n=1 Tax=Collimonas sp. TaxID=1963772 RepID=UPI002C0E2DDD|nr:phospholipase C, phosphocholine-specific [Collimonas sp.]HWX02887.1 phospholipase C, phosphocholine-specific [Collimonas sp.]
MTQKSRRDFLSLTAKTAAAAAAAGVFPDTIRQALAVPAYSKTGTIADVEHVVIFMQENRSFDHYFGKLAGVRGFGDPRAISLPSGQSVWFQPNGGSYVLPYHFDAKGTNATHVGLNHSWKGTEDAWKNWDAWVPKKTAYTMGYFDRGDLPFYYAVADAFTICDAYHCSIFGPTDPNRFYALSGTAGENITGLNDGNLYNANPIYNGDLNNDDISAATTAAAPNWKTYAEVLQANGVSWKAYQEFDNYGDNYLAYFRNFRVNSDGSRLSTSSPLYINGRALADGSNQGNTAGTKGDLLIKAFKRDIDGVNGKTALPQVSWIFAPYEYCEHPEASPNAGEDIASRLLGALASNPEVWSKTVFLINYDENDGFFDHMQPNVPPMSADKGLTTLADPTIGEVYQQVPKGLGPRVPMLVISPWSRGGKVCSQLFDHTSVLRFLEEWLSTGKGLDRDKVTCKNISPWRRAVCGDLTSAFDFKNPNKAWPQITPAPPYQNVDSPVSATPPAQQTFPLQESNQNPRPACHLPYQFHVDVRAAAQSGHRELKLNLGNTGRAGAAFIAYSNLRQDGPWQYAVEAGKALRDVALGNWSSDQYELRVHGPNGFFRECKGSFAVAGSAAAARPEILVRDDYERQAIVLILFNEAGAKTCTFTVSANAGPSRGFVAPYRVEAGRSLRLMVPLAAAKGWYDFSVTADSDAGFLRRIAGHVESAARSWTDPQIGVIAPSTLSTPTPRIRQGGTLAFNYSTALQTQNPRNWIGVFPAAATVPDQAGYKTYSVYEYAAALSGQVTLKTQGLAPGSYKVWFLANDGYAEQLAGPVVFTVTA